MDFNTCISAIPSKTHEGLGGNTLQDGTPQHVVRIAGNSGSEEWLFWVDVEQVMLAPVLFFDTAANSG